MCVYTRGDKSQQSGQIRQLAQRVKWKLSTPDKSCRSHQKLATVSVSGWVAAVPDLCCSILFIHHRRPPYCCSRAGPVNDGVVNSLWKWQVKTPVQSKNSSSEPATQGREEVVGRSHTRCRGAACGIGAHRLLLRGGIKGRRASHHQSLLRF